jgi:hypothetical protein
MNENQNPIEIIQLLPKLIQALYSDGVLYFSGEVSIATENRKNTLLNDINLVKEQISNLEKILG